MAHAICGSVSEVYGVERKSKEEDGEGKRGLADFVNIVRRRFGFSLYDSLILRR